MSFKDSVKFKNAMAAAKALIGFAAEKPDAEAFASAKVKGGEAVVEYENTEPGTAVTVDGQPAPDGELVLDNGWTFIIKDGKIESASEVAPEDAPKEPIAAEGEVVTMEMYNSLLARVEALETAKGEFSAQIAAVPTSAQIEKFTGTLGGFVESLEAIPAATTAHQQFEGDTALSLNEQLAFVAQMINEKAGK